MRNTHKKESMYRSCIAPVLLAVSLLVSLLYRCCIALVLLIVSLSVPLSVSLSVSLLYRCCIACCLAVAIQQRYNTKRAIQTAIQQGDTRKRYRALHMFVYCRVLQCIALCIVICCHRAVSRSNTARWRKKSDTRAIQKRYRSDTLKRGKTTPIQGENNP